MLAEKCANNDRRKSMSLAYGFDRIGSCNLNTCSTLIMNSEFFKLIWKFFKHYCRGKMYLWTKQNPNFEKSLIFDQILKENSKF